MARPCYHALALLLLLAWARFPLLAAGADVPDFGGLGFPEASAEAHGPAGPIPRYDELPPEPRARVLAYRRIVSFLQASAKRPLAAAGSCADYAGLWLELLGGKGYPLHLAQTQGVGTVRVDDRVERAGKIHFFVVDRGLCREGDDGSREIVIDPTYTQFLEPGECLFEDSRAVAERAGQRCDPDDALAKLPGIFVGTRDDVEALYERFRSRLRATSASGLDPDAGRYEPASLASLHYSYGANATLRTNLAFGSP